ncbi:MAG: hypothetical protein HYR55_04885 [Acidobacteria bacterium]|nr:hypothetical protein [Acidobacteriota bacterium]MBI3658511.1 hypothetical protein [Acidobacteriota bacterium]
MPEVQLTAQGKATKYENLFALQVAGLAEVLVLEGGKRAEELKRTLNVLNKNLKVTGNLHPSHVNRPPGLTVDEFQVVNLKDVK